jgi:hypothetical protein
MLLEFREAANDDRSVQRAAQRAADERRDLRTAARNRLVRVGRFSDANILKRALQRRSSLVVVR